MNTDEKIDDIVQFYAGIEKDFRDIDRLTTGVRRLACLLFDYATQIGELYATAKGSEYARKAAFERERLRLLDEGKSAAAAEIGARSAVESLVFSETETDVAYRSAQLRYNAARDVLESMRQHLATLKGEKRLEMAGAAQNI